MKRPAKASDIMRLTAEAAKGGRLVYSNHANERIRERGIIKPEVEYVLEHGHHEARKDSYSEEFQAWDYAIRGKTLDGRNLRVVVAIVAPNILVVTTIDLDKED